VAKILDTFAMKNQLKGIVRVLTRHLRVPIRAGPCRGLLWSLTTRSRFIRGAYEPALVNFIQAALKPDDAFWDMGAHFGYYTLLASRTVSSGHCQAFEPNPQNLWYLRHHLQWNRISNATVHPIALAGKDGTCQFDCSGTGSGTLGSGTLTVQTRSIDSLVQSRTCPPPTFLKMDVEASETEVLNGAGNVIKEHRPTLCLATHGGDTHTECRRILTGHGYALHDLPDQSLLIAAGAGRVFSNSLLAALRGNG
jgi:FkbM family methyltransferase